MCEIGWTGDKIGPLPTEAAPSSIGNFGTHLSESRTDFCRQVQYPVRNVLSVSRVHISTTSGLLIDQLKTMRGKKMFGISARFVDL